MDWAGMKPVRLERASLDEAALATVAGTYRFDGEDYVLRVSGNRWQLTEPDGEQEYALPITEDRLYFPEAGQLFDIDRDEDGKVVSISLGGAVLPRVGD